MKLYSLFTDWFVIRWLEYLKFNVKSDNYHTDITLNVLDMYNKNGAMVKEFNIFGSRSKTLYLKSTGYYIKNKSENKKKQLYNVDLEKCLYKDQSNNNYFNSTVYLTEKAKAGGTSFNKSIKVLKKDSEASQHIELLFLITKFKLELVTEAFVVNFILNNLNKDIEVFVPENAFEQSKNYGSSHEFGYWLNYILDFNELCNNIKLKNAIYSYFEKLHLIFVRRKMFYHDVVGKDRSLINVSGVTLTVKAFFRYSLITKDFRFANAGMFLIDFVKQLQINNKGFIQNTFPIHKGNSRYKFPSWTINYFLEVLILKKQVLNEFKNCLIN